jgi:hypothetical protein
MLPGEKGTGGREGGGGLQAVACWMEKPRDENDETNERESCCLDSAILTTCLVLLRLSTRFVNKKRDADKESRSERGEDRCVLELGLGPTKNQQITGLAWKQRP